jgi:hypothetical protein
MPLPSYKVLGQVNPTSGTRTVLYSVPRFYNSKVTTLTICNTGTSATQFNIEIQDYSPNNTSTAYYTNYNTWINAKDTIILNQHFSLNQGSNVYITPIGTSNLAFSLFGKEQNAPYAVTPNVDYLVVAGGGGGGSSVGGGGGAGGLLTGTGLSVIQNTPTIIVVGAGGGGGAGGVTAGSGGSTTRRENGVLGSNSNIVAATIVTAVGGGYGVSTMGYGANSNPGLTVGGSGGGNAESDTQVAVNTGGPSIPGQGYDGGGGLWGTVNAAAGGGGGAGELGGNAYAISGGLPTASPHGGKGGNGYISSITGVSYYYAGGGGGGSFGSSIPGDGGLGGGGGGQCATGAGQGLGGTGGSAPGGDASTTTGLGAAAGNGGVNTGSGGGGGAYSGGAYSGGAGGAGVVIVRYPNTYPLAWSTTGNPNVIITGGNIIYRFWQSGSIQF